MKHIRITANEAKDICNNKIFRFERKMNLVYSSISKAAEEGKNNISVTYSDIFREYNLANQLKNDGYTIKFERYCPMDPCNPCVDYIFISW